MIKFDRDSSEISRTFREYSLGTTSVWPLLFGSIVRKANECSSSYIFSQGISPRMICVNSDSSFGIYK